MNFFVAQRQFFYGVAAVLGAFFLVVSDVGQHGFLSFLSHGLIYMGVFFHEIGHALLGWVFGYVSLPTFDFAHGGGMAWHLDRSWALQIILWCAGVYGLYKLKHSDAAFFFLPFVLFFGALFAVSLTDYHEAVILFMGHGGEALIGGFLLGRGILNVLLTRPAERWINVFVGAFFILHQMQFCWGLLHDADAQDQYETQKGSHGFGDLSRIAAINYDWSQNGVVIFLMVFTITAAVGIPLLLRYLKSL